jgi:hypothetical protein
LSYLVDTNVLSEVRRRWVQATARLRAVNPAVLGRWLDGLRQIYRAAVRSG